MSNNTLASSISDGVISRRQAYDLIEHLWESITSLQSNAIYVGDIEVGDGLQGFYHLAVKNSPKDFEPTSMLFPDILDINTKNKEVWMIYALTTPFAFERVVNESEECRKMSLEDAMKETISTASPGIIKALFKGTEHEDHINNILSEDEEFEHPFE